MGTEVGEWEGKGKRLQGQVWAGSQSQLCFLRAPTPVWAARLGEPPSQVVVSRS